MSFSPAPRHALTGPTIHPWTVEMGAFDAAQNGTPSSGTTTAAARSYLIPIRLLEPFTVLKAWWLNGATVGTDSLDIGVYQMTNMTTVRLDLIRSTGTILSAGANVVQGSATWKVAANAAALTTGSDSTDATTYTTASVTLKAGRLYLLSFTNTAASAAVASGIAGGPTWVSRSSTQYNTTAHRVSIWSGVPTVDYTGTIVISFGATQTGASWALNEFSGVDTSTTHGVVQQAVGTGNSTTPLATLAAFGSANNATFGALGNTADSTTTPGAGFTELSDLGAAVTPAQFLQTQWQVGNDTTVDGTITSGQWGACAVEIKADASSFVIPPSTPGGPNIYLAHVLSGTTATVFRAAQAVNLQRSGGHLQANTNFPLASTVVPIAVSNSFIPMAGFSLRTLLD
jgi:hypothetical protein